MLTIFRGVHHRPNAVPLLVASYIFAAYWFTASTSFANPAVTVARALTDSFSGIRAIDVPAFIVSQAAGAAAAALFARVLAGPHHRREMRRTPVRRLTCDRIGGPSSRGS